MSNSEPSNLEIQKRFAAMERRIAKLEISVGEIDRVIDPEGWIGEAFDVIDRDLSELKNEMLQRMDAMDSKLDIIMRHITGLSDQK